ncbi:ABC transporter substrate-binding protein [Kineococcus sp. R8]|nr:ABC transporter substrate-binding protein [Kineococcus siccus]
MGGAAGGAALLAACGSGTESPTAGASGGSSGAASFGAVTVQLSWVKNVEFAGEFLADDRGYYRDAGFDSVELTAGGAAGTSAEAALATGRAFLGVSAPLITAPAITQGAALKIVGATFQKNPFVVVSLEAAPIPSPKDMVGKKIGVQDSNDLAWNALLKANDLDPASITRVPFQSNLAAITTGEVDGYIGYSTSGAAALSATGTPATQFLFADNGLPLFGETLVVAQQSIDDERAKLKAFLAATARGWSDAVADQAAAAQVVVTKYGKDLGLAADAQQAVMGRQAELMVSEETKANGLLTMSDELIAASLRSLAAAGITIEAGDLFDPSLLAEVYEEDPSLKG